MCLLRRWYVTQQIKTPGSEKLLVGICSQQINHSSCRLAKKCQINDMNFTHMHTHELPVIFKGTIFLTFRWVKGAVEWNSDFTSEYKNKESSVQESDRRWFSNTMFPLSNINPMYVKKGGKMVWFKNPILVRNSLNYTCTTSDIYFLSQGICVHNICKCSWWGKQYILTAIDVKLFIANSLRR